MPSVSVDGLIHYSLRLRPELWVFLYLPPDLRREEVTRIAAMLETLVLAPDKAVGISDARSHP